MNKKITDKTRLDFLQNLCKPLKEKDYRILFVAIAYKTDKENLTFREALDLVIKKEVETEDITEAVRETKRLENS